MKYKLTEKINVYTILAQIAIMWRNRKTITNDVWFFHYRTPRWTFVKNGFQNVKLCWKVKKKIKKFPTNSRKDSQRSYSFQKNRFLRILPMPPVWVTLRPGTSPPPWDDKSSSTLRVRCHYRHRALSDSSGEKRACMRIRERFSSTA